MTRTILYNKKKISYQVIGQGQPVILIHGFGEDGRIWKEQALHLSGKHRLIIPDLPGSGASEQINDMSMEGMAEVIHTIIHEEGIDACPVLGHSMGGYITLALMEKYWNHVSAFGLVHSTAWADSDEKKEARRKGIAFIEANGAFPFLKTSIPNLFSPRYREENPGIVDQFITEQHNFSARALVLYYEAMMARPDRTELLRKATVPVLFIMGEQDQAIPISDVLQQCHLPGISYIHILRKSGHMGMMEEKETVNGILEKFLLSY